MNAYLYEEVKQCNGALQLVYNKGVERKGNMGQNKKV